jgi:uncharacterized membrane protein YoaK (UPF0700 family)
MRRYDRPLIAAAVSLAGLAGFVDAIGFLSLGGFFVSFMSGNTTRLGVALAIGAGGYASRAASLIGAFVLGVMAAIWIAQAVPQRRKPAVLAAMTLLLLGAAGAHAGGADGAALLLMAAAMGAENGVFLRDSEVSVGLTYMTGTLVRFAQRAAQALAGGERWAWLPYLLLWLGFLGGVTAGAAAFARIGLEALWIAVAAAALLTGAVARLTRPR